MNRPIKVAKEAGAPLNFITNEHTGNGNPETAVLSISTSDLGLLSLLAA